MSGAGLYLTIDDGPSERFTELVDFLNERNIQAVFFNRGDAMEARPEAVLYGIQRGHIMANHTYSHKKSSKLPLNEIKAEILRTEDILRDLYSKAGANRNGKYFRFPYMDRGMGTALIDPENAKPEHLSPINTLITNGLGHIAPTSISDEQIEKKNAIQEFLLQHNYTNIRVRDVNVPWYAESEMAQTVDSLCTFSTSDWAISERHKGKHGFESLDDLKAQIDNNEWLKDSNSNHIILAHDQAEIFDVTTALIDYFLEKDFKFLDFG
ncbi:MAG: polysaccharide deacetylase family protein [Pseudomonadota bacterium]